MQIIIIDEYILELLSFKISYNRIKVIEKYKKRLLLLYI